MQNNEPIDKAWFLTSSRFLAGLIACFTVLLGPDGQISGPEVYNFLLSLSALFIGLKSVIAQEALSNKKITLSAKTTTDVKKVYDTDTI